MKKGLILFVLLLTAGFMSAQTAETATKKACSKTCAKTCTSKTKIADGDTKVASALTVADIAAEADESVNRKVCADTGAVCYYKESVCEKSGKVSFEEVFYNEDSKTFVNMSPTDGTAVKAATMESSTKAKTCAKTCKKTCTKKTSTEKT